MDLLAKLKLEKEQRDNPVIKKETSKFIYLMDKINDKEIVSLMSSTTNTIFPTHNIMDLEVINLIKTRGKLV